ncbi:flippase [Bacillus mycoides]|uniref:flippase n=1 Tax=Bacillus TaxID=1386 RepID=UPI000B4B5DA4|nr:MULTISPECIES: flippase [Bacillus cereus group]QBP93525.1 flippase [Bacillus mycoides]QWG79070.1 flippase [Bacillus mycoides]TXR89362.1 flippase [Bacillus sp. AR13-1]WOA63406.1 flippase [Bacillus mycoides]
MNSSIIKNIFYLFFSTAFTRAVNAFSIIILASYLGAKEYGAFSVAVAFSMVAGYFTDVGLSNVVLREGSKGKKDDSIVMSTYIKMRVMLLIITLLASTVIIYFLYSKGNLSKVMFLLVLPTVIGLSMQSISVVYFQLKEEMKQIAKIRTLSAVLSVFFVVLGMLCKFDLNSIAFLYGCSYVIAGIYGLYMLFTKNSLRFSSEFDKNLLTGVPAFIISGLLIMILPQLGPLVLEKTVSLNELGNFSVAYRIPAALYQIPGVVAGAFYPVLFRYYNSKDLIKHKELNFLQVKIMGLMGICLCIPLFHLSNIIVEIVFGEEWGAAAIGLKILSLMLFLQSFNFPLADGLTTRNLQSKRTITQFLAVLLGIVLYYVFSLKFGVVGGATAAVSIEIIMLLGFIVFNPNKKELIIKIMVPYFSVFIAFTLTSAFYLNTFPITAALINLLSVVSLIVLLDKELRARLMKYIQKKRNVEV